MMRKMETRRRKVQLLKLKKKKTLTPMKKHLHLALMENASNGEELQAMKRER